MDIDTRTSMDTLIRTATNLRVPARKGKRDDDADALMATSDHHLIITLLYHIVISHFLFLFFFLPHKHPPFNRQALQR